MKKISQLLIWGVLLILLASTDVSAYTVFVGIDDSIRLDEVDGFQFDIVNANLIDYTLETYHTSDNILDLWNGSLPEDSSLWSVQKYQSGYIGINQNMENTESSLVAGIILSIEYEDTFSLNEFKLASSLYEDGKYPKPWELLEKSITGEKIYTYSAVPIPTTLFLLGSGLIGLIGLRRKQMNK